MKSWLVTKPRGMSFGWKYHRISVSLATCVSLLQHVLPVKPCEVLFHGKPFLPEPMRNFIIVLVNLHLGYSFHDF